MERECPLHATGATAPRDGALTLSFCPDLDLSKPLCAAPGLRSLTRTSGVWLLPPPAALPAPWYALHGLDDTVCPAAEADAAWCQLTAAGAGAGAS